MPHQEVKARRVGDSVVVTLPKPILEESRIAEGEMLLLETSAHGSVIVRRSSAMGSPIEEAKLEIAVMRKRLHALDAEIGSAAWGINNSAPTEDFPWVDDQMVTEGVMLDYTWKRAKIELEVAEKRLELFRLGADPDCPPSA